MKLKFDEQGHVVVVDGKPVYVHDDGKEIPFDAVGTTAVISRLNAEAKGHREAKEAAEARAKLFEGIDDPDAARKAIELAKNIKDGELLTAGKVEEMKAAAKRAAEEQVAAASKSHAEQLNAANKELESVRHQFYEERIGGNFAGSKFITEKLAIPSDLARAAFGQHFKIEDGKTVAYDTTGNRIFSRARPGDLATFDEALEVLVDRYPHRDSILKSSGASGSGAKGGGGNGGGKTMTRAEFGQLSPLDQAAAGKAAGAGQLSIID